MKKFSLYFIAFLVFALKLSAQSDVSVARWKTHEIVVDGNDRDWVKPLNLYEDKTGLLFAISNDSSTLYFNFTITDPTKMMKMISSGWSLELSLKDKRNKIRGSITFPAVKMDGPKGKMSENTNNKMSGMAPDETTEPISDIAPMIASYGMSLQSVITKGFIFSHGYVSLRDTSGIVVRVGESDSKGLLYEVAIPLNELFEEDTMRLNESMAMLVSVNAAAKPSGDSSSGEISGGGASGGSGMPGGGGPGGGGPGGPGGGPGGGGPGGSMSKGGMSGFSGNMSATSQRVSFKQKFRLVNH